MDPVSREEKKPRADRYLGMVLGERYRVLRKLGEGGMGSVYAGEHIRIGRQVAIKILHAQFANHEEALQRFLNEAKAAGTLDHPHVAAAMDFGEADDGSPYLVLELLQGRTLHEELNAQAPFPPSRARVIGGQIAQALQAAHDEGIVHRDLKPENVFLVAGRTTPDFVKVLDFGISKFVDVARSGIGTRSGEAMGTPQYMAPEQFLDASKADARSDVYSLGAILYEMLSGRRPHEGESFGALAIEVVGEAPPELESLVPELPEPLCALVMECLAKDPELRPSTMLEVERGLRAELAPTDARRVDGPEDPRQGELVAAAGVAVEATGVEAAEVEAAAVQAAEDEAADLEAARIEARAREALAPRSRQRQVMVAGAAVAVALSAILVWVVGSSDTPARTEPSPAAPTAETGARAETSADGDELDTLPVGVDFPAVIEVAPDAIDAVEPLAPTAPEPPAREAQQARAAPEPPRARPAAASRPDPVAGSRSEPPAPSVGPAAPPAPAEVPRAAPAPEPAPAGGSGWRRRLDSNNPYP